MTKIRNYPSVWNWVCYLVEAGCTVTIHPGGSASASLEEVSHNVPFIEIASYGGNNGGLGRNAHAAATLGLLRKKLARASSEYPWRIQVLHDGVWLDDEDQRIRGTQEAAKKWCQSMLPLQVRITVGDRWLITATTIDTL